MSKSISTDQEKNKGSQSQDSEQNKGHIDPGKRSVHEEKNENTFPTFQNPPPPPPEKNKEEK